MKSYMQKKETVKRQWFVIDANGLPLGRVATRAAHILRGKHKPTYTPHIDCGDYVIIVNASKVNLTGNKLEDKMYYNHSMYAGGLRERSAKVMRENYPIEMIERAVFGMLPHNRLGRAMGKKLFVYAGETHPHIAQSPIVTGIK
jgi:large subunit ribosomal protein L13